MLYYWDPSFLRSGWMVEFSDNLFIISGARMTLMNPDANPAQLVREYIATAKAGKQHVDGMDNEVLSMLIRADKAGVINSKTEALMVEGADSEQAKVNALTDMIGNMANPTVAAMLAGTMNAQTNGNFDLKVRASTANLELDAKGKFSEKEKGRINGGIVSVIEQAKQGWKDKVATEKAQPPQNRQI